MHNLSRCRDAEEDANVLLFFEDVLQLMCSERQYTAGIEDLLPMSGLKTKVSVLQLATHLIQKHSDALEVSALDVAGLCGELDQYGLPDNSDDESSDCEDEDVSPACARCEQQVEAWGELQSTRPSAPLLGFKLRLPHCPQVTVATDTCSLDQDAAPCNALAGRVWLVPAMPDQEGLSGQPQPAREVLLNILGRETLQTAEQRLQQPCSSSCLSSEPQGSLSSQGSEAAAFEVFQKTHKLYDLTFELVGLPAWEADDEEDNAGFPVMEVSSWQGFTAGLRASSQCNMSDRVSMGSRWGSESGDDSPICQVQSTPSVTGAGAQAEGVAAQACQLVLGDGQLTCGKTIAHTEFSVVRLGTLGPNPAAHRAASASMEVVIKECAPHHKMEGAAEGLALLQLRHWSGCVQLVGCGLTTDGSLQLLLERCDSDLMAWAASQSTMSTGRTKSVFKMFASVAERVVELHARGWAHCDLKPGNILLQGGHPVLADFGDARQASSPGAAIQLEEFRGTVGWAAAEMLSVSSTKLVDARAADVWSLGCMLFHLLTGDMLFEGEHDAQRPLTNKGCWLTDQQLGALEEACGGAGHLNQAVLALLLDIFVPQAQRPTAAQLSARVAGVNVCTSLSLPA